MTHTILFEDGEPVDALISKLQSNDAARATIESMIEKLGIPEPTFVEYNSNWGNTWVNWFNTWVNWANGWVNWYNSP